jgi:hypothetical protein
LKYIHRKISYWDQTPCSNDPTPTTANNNATKIWVEIETCQNSSQEKKERKFDDGS